MDLWRSNLQGSYRHYYNILSAQQNWKFLDSMLTTHICKTCDIRSAQSSFYCVREHGSFHENFITFVCRKFTVFLSFNILYSQYADIQVLRSPQNSENNYRHATKCLSWNIKNGFSKNCFFYLKITADFPKFSIYKFISCLMN